MPGHRLLFLVLFPVYMRIISRSLYSLGAFAYTHTILHRRIRKRSERKGKALRVAESLCDTTS